MPFDTIRKKYKILKEVFTTVPNPNVTLARTEPEKICNAPVDPNSCCTIHKGLGALAWVIKQRWWGQKEGEGDIFLLSKYQDLVCFSYCDMREYKSIDRYYTTIGFLATNFDAVLMT